MALEDFLAAILNPNGTQQASPSRKTPLYNSGVNDGPVPGLLQSALAGAPAVPQMAAAPAPASGGGILNSMSGGGIGGILGGIFAPQATGRASAAKWLQTQGLDAGTAQVLASNKNALQSYILQRAGGNKPIEINGQLVDPNTYKVVGDYRNAPERKIEKDASGTPRYTDTGETVYKTDQTANNEMFPGKSPEAVGLNHLITIGALTKDQAAEVAAGKTVTGPNGEIIFMTPNGLVTQSAGGQSQPGGNILTGPKLSEDQKKASGFAVRADAADKIVSDPAITAAGVSPVERGKAAAPLVGNYMVSPEYQKFDQAQRDFVNAVLRRESGAAISQSEFDNAQKQYFPAPGDGPDVLAQKAANRKAAVDSLKLSGEPVPTLPTSPKPAGGILSTIPKAAGDDTPPPSYTGKNWKYLTPEQRKLWQ